MAEPRYEYKTITVPMLDTGIGIAMGYESDQALRDHVARERLTLSPEVRAAVDDYEREIHRRMFWG
jgi:hypothetical protein